MEITTKNTGGGKVKNEGVAIDSGRASAAGRGRVYINNAEGRIEFYDENNVLMMKLGFCGLDNNGNPMYGMLVNDGTNDRYFAGYQKDGF